VTNYLEKLLCVEVLEKISRFHRFLCLEPDSLNGQGTAVVKVFVRALDAIVNSVAPFVARLAEKATLAKWERVTMVRRLLASFDAVARLHSQLQFIYGVWVRPETHVFIKNVLEFIPNERRPENVNIILSNDYSFRETDLSFYMEDVVHAADVFENESPSVFLPKIERENPLNWAVLVHECGHVDSEGIRKLLERPEIRNAQGTDNAALETSRNWAEEIYCDLFAAKILGPAYLASFATSALVIAGLEGSEISSDTHPPDIVRIALVQEVLKKSQLRVPLSRNWFGSDDLSSFFYNVLEERTSVSRRHSDYPTGTSLPLLTLGEFADSVCEEVDEIISLNQQLTIKDFARIGHLAKRLADGILIGSFPDPKNRERAKKEFLDHRIEPGRLEKAKYAIQESRVLIWEIVNAGWLQKIEHLYPEAFHLFFGFEDPSGKENEASSSNTPIREKIIMWSDKLERIDKLLLSSIEASEIQKLMEDDQSGGLS